MCKAELSTKNKYWIERHRYYELKHFCLQYDIWVEALKALSVYQTSRPDKASTGNDICRSTEKIVEAIESYTSRITLLKDASSQVDPLFAPYILEAVTKNLNYDYLRLHYNIPIGREGYYTLYRKFFWILNRFRD